MRLKTINQFLSKLNDELTWRQREIIDLRMQAQRKNAAGQKPLLRAGTTLLYSHWEGFIKNASEHLLNYIANQHLKNSELSDIFLIHSYKSHLFSLSDSKSVVIALESLRFIFGEMNASARISYRNFVDTESNLKSSVFDRIARSVGVDVNNYMHLYPFIDETIVNKRNSIAHGEYLDIDADEYKRISDKVFELIRCYKTDIENIAVQRTFTRKSV